MIDLDELIKLIIDDGDVDWAVEELDGEVLNYEYVESSRWHEWWVTHVKFGDKYYAIYKQKNATEIQDGQPWQAWIEEVEPVEVVVTKYKPTGTQRDRRWFSGD